VGELRRWIAAAAPKLAESFRVVELRSLPRLLAEESARRWLIARGVPASQLTPANLQQLLAMATDAASPPRQHFPGRLMIARRGGRISANAP
jgi:hypothetical protein